MNSDLNSKFNEYTCDPQVVLDDSLLYSTDRMLCGGYCDEARSLFIEFLHTLLSYKRIILNTPSVDYLGNSIKSLIENLNRDGEVVQTQNIECGWKSVSSITQSVCQIIDKSPNKYRLLQLRIPPSYYKESHYDYGKFSHQISKDFIPIAIFSFHALHYMGYSRRLSYTQKDPVIYAAASGRVSIIDFFLNKRDLQSPDFDENKYIDFARNLDLPERGFEFAYQNDTFKGYEIRRFAQQVISMPPKQALDFVLDCRRSSDIQRLQSEWSTHVLSDSKFAAIGPTVAQSSPELILGNTMITIAKE